MSVVIDKEEGQSTLGKKQNLKVLVEASRMQAPNTQVA